MNAIQTDHWGFRVYFGIVNTLRFPDNGALDRTDPEGLYVFQLEGTESNAMIEKFLINGDGAAVANAVMEFIEKSIEIRQVENYQFFLYFARHYQRRTLATRYPQEYAENLRFIPFDEALHHSVLTPYFPKTDERFHFQDLSHFPENPDYTPNLPTIEKYCFDRTIYPFFKKVTDKLVLGHYGEPSDLQVFKLRESTSSHALQSEPQVGALIARDRYFSYRHRFLLQFEKAPTPRFDEEEYLDNLRPTASGFDEVFNAAWELPLFYKLSVGSFQLGMMIFSPEWLENWVQANYDAAEEAQKGSGWNLPPAFVFSSEKTRFRQSVKTSTAACVLIKATDPESKKKPMMVVSHLAVYPGSAALVLPAAWFISDAPKYESESNYRHWVEADQKAMEVSVFSYDTLFRDYNAQIEAPTVANHKKFHAEYRGLTAKHIRKPAGKLDIPQEKPPVAKD